MNSKNINEHIKDCTERMFEQLLELIVTQCKRVKWDTQTRREYLLETYGKRSLQVLSLPELIEFLGYLESLPTPLSSLNLSHLSKNIKISVGKKKSDSIPF
ncbi:hypothetical protein [Cyanothece sp. BG0011]|uniref:hypothetical protein n=1 Tax=Cyanothece sp. BG0011 TaxID=2082950 RepID=UPI000D1E8ABC|nr:hypothetical protein [Cyanothece sp. BG0011]